MTEFMCGIELPHYVSHKEVQALEIEEVAFGVVVFKDWRLGKLECPAEMFARYQPQSGDFLVFYADGYKSFSPRKAFLEGYSPRAPNGCEPNSPVGWGGHLS